MNKYYSNKNLITIILLLVSYPTFVCADDRLDFKQLMQRIADTHPVFRVGKLNIERAQQQNKRVESQLGWQLNSIAGIDHDLSVFGSPTDKLDLQAGVNRQLESGSSISFTGSYNYTDSAISVGPDFPNPSQNTRLDLSYRMPLLKGDGNPAYVQALEASEIDTAIANADIQKLYNDTAVQAQSLFYNYAYTYARLNDITDALKRTKKLVAYIESKYKLGLAEEKDRLQVISQLKAKESEYSALKIIWENQRVSLNRLMGKSWKGDFIPVITNFDIGQYTLDELKNMAEEYSPVIKKSYSRLKLSESRLEVARQEKKSKLDLVLSIGTRTSSGDNNTGHVSEEDYASSVYLEYQRPLDDSGLNAGVRQAELDRHIALENINIEKDNIYYKVSGLHSEIEAAKLAFQNSQKHLSSEKLKLSEVRARYENGRADIAQLLTFENDYSFSQLSYHRQKIELENKNLSMQLLTGMFWRSFTNLLGDIK